MGDLLLDLKYEGISTLCFECGIVGHRKEDCPNLQHHASTLGDGGMKSALENMEGMEKGTQQEAEKEKEYGPWTLVANRKKQSSNRRTTGGSDWRSRVRQRHEEGHDVRDSQQMGELPEPDDSEWTPW